MAAKQLSETIEAELVEVLAEAAPEILQSVFERLRPKAAVPAQETEMWGVPVIVRGLTVGERLKLVEDRLSGENISARQIYERALGQVYDPATMEAAFSEEQIAELLDDTEASVIEAIVALANELSGLAPDDEDDAGKDS